MMQIGGRQVRGFGLGAVSRPSSDSAIVPIIAGAAAGIGAAVLARRYYDTQPLETAVGSVLIGAGVAIGVSILTKPEKTSRHLTPRGPQMVITNASVDDLVAAKLAEGGYPNVSAYQKVNGLFVDGVAGHDTLTAMGFGYLFDLAGRGMLSPGQTQLNAKNTPLTPEEAAQALSAGYQSVMSEAPTPEILALLLAQSGHETADWQKIPNYAFGGIKASSGNKYVQAFVTPEGNPSKLYVLAFAAYPSTAEGAEAYIRTLKSRSNWWNGLQTGTPEGLVAGLTVQPYAYFTGSAAKYLTSVQRRFDQYTDLAKVSV